MTKTFSDSEGTTNLAKKKNPLRGWLKEKGANGYILLISLSLFFSLIVFSLFFGHLMHSEMLQSLALFIGIASLMATVSSWNSMNSKGHQILELCDYETSEVVDAAETVKSLEEVEV